MGERSGACAWRWSFLDSAIRQVRNTEEKIFLNAGTAGFGILEWMNYSDKVIEHYERMLSAPPKLTGRLIFGDDAPETQRNSQRNLTEDRTIFWMITAERPKL